MKKSNKNEILLITISVAVLLFTIIGATYAYFSATITGNATTKNVSATTETCGMTVSYKTGGNSISLTNIAAPKGGGNITKDLYFGVTSTCNSQRTININLAEVTNGFCQKVANQNDTTCANTGNISVADELYYVINSCTDSTYATCTTSVKTATAVPTTAGSLVTGQTIGVKGSKYYKLTIGFKNKDVPQNYNQGKSFSGKVVIAENI